MGFSGTNILCHLVYMYMLCKCQGSFIGVKIGARRSDNDKTSIDVTCPGGHVISDLEIVAGKNTVNPPCTGNTASLKSATYNCYWNQSCRIEFPSGRIITCHTGECSECLWKTPEFMRVTRAKCVLEEEVISIIPMENLIRKRRATTTNAEQNKKQNNKEKGGKSNSRNNRVRRVKCKKNKCSKGDRKKGNCTLCKREKTRKNGQSTPNLATTTQEENSGLVTNINQTDQGVIKSHPGYPWFYRESENASIHSLRYDGNTHSYVSLEVRIKHICDIDNLTIKTSDSYRRKHSCVIDNLTIKSNDKKVFLTNDRESDQSVGYFVYKTTENITFTFERGAESPGCEGFVICYKGLSDCSPASRSICDMVQNTMATVTLTVYGVTYEKPCCPNDKLMKAGLCYFRDPCKE